MQLDLEILQGGTFILPLTWQDSTKQPIDITGRSARMQIRESYSSATVLLELTDLNDRIILGTTNGSITLKLTALETEALDWSYGVYDLELYYDNSGEEHVDKIIRGDVIVIPEATK